MEDVKIKFGLKVKQLRIYKGYSQEKLAELADLDRTYIPGIENGKRNHFQTGTEGPYKHRNAKTSEPESDSAEWRQL